MQYHSVFLFYTCFVKLSTELSEVVYKVNIDAEFSVGALENILIDMQGMGFFNGMMNKVVTSMVQQNVHTVLMASGKDFMKKEFVDCSLLDHMYTSFKIL